jgi:phage terminase large subunit-like protein
VQEYLSKITALETNCTVEALSKEAGLDDGFRSIYSSIDEIHQHKDNKIYKAIYNGTRALPETLISMITTRGDKIQSFCKEMDDYAIKVLRGEATAEDFFVDIFALDPGDDIWDEANWIKANPFICRNADMLETLRRDAQTAKDMGGAELRDFMTKSLNLWVENTDTYFIISENWDKCGSERTLSAFEGQACYVGIDLSSGGDLTTLALEFDDNPDERIYIYSQSFMPRGRIQEHITTDIAPYDIWEQQGLITVTGGDMDFKNDYKFIIKHLKELKEEYGLTFKAIGIDPHNADGILSDLEELGCPVVLVKQTCKELNDATVDMQLLIKSQKVEYDKRNELLTWSALNARIVENSMGERKIDKKLGARNSRIDPIDAIIDAHAVKLQLTKENIDLNDEFNRYMELMGL